ncbi:hypothetical protein D3C87_1402350 [compost metagenome]
MAGSPQRFICRDGGTCGLCFEAICNAAHGATGKTANRSANQSVFTSCRCPAFTRTKSVSGSSSCPAQSGPPYCFCRATWDCESACNLTCKPFRATAGIARALLNKVLIIVSRFATDPRQRTHLGRELVCKAEGSNVGKAANGVINATKDTALRLKTTCLCHCRLARLSNCIGCLCCWLSLLRLRATERRGDLINRSILLFRRHGQKRIVHFHLFAVDVECCHQGSTLQLTPEDVRLPLPLVPPAGL